MSLHSQLQFIEQLHASGRALQAAPLEALFVQTHPVPAQAWSDLAWVQLRLGAVDAARPLLEKAYAIDPYCPEALDGLAEVHARLGATDQARRFGLEALDAKDALSAQASVSPAPRETLTGQRVVAFSLFGRDAFYSECAVRNAADVARWYPGWECRFYIGTEVCEEVRARLRALGAQVMLPPAAHAHLPGTVWRFLALDDLQASHVVCRDADSPITLREMQAVQHWLASGCTAHVMRDHWTHTELMLAGLWGARTAALRGISAGLQTYFTQVRHPTHADQHFLRDWVWPRVRHSVLQHDSCFAWQGSADFPQPRTHDAEHVGNAPYDPVTLHPSANAPPELSYSLLRYTASSVPALLGRYRVQRHADAYTVRMPPGYGEQVQRGELALVW